MIEIKVDQKWSIRNGSKSNKNYVKITKKLNKSCWEISSLDSDSTQMITTEELLREYAYQK